MTRRGFTLVETLVGVFIFSLVIFGLYQSFYLATQTAEFSRIKTEAALLATEQFELIRNLPYQNVGLVNGLPVGVLPRNQTLTRAGLTFDVNTTIRSVDDPFDGTIGGSPNDTAPADYKNVTLSLSCENCALPTPLSFSATFAPKNLENSTGNGALFIRVIDAASAVVRQAQVHVENRSATPAIVIDETTDNNGLLQLVDVPPGNNVYTVSVTKSGYSSDGTVATSSGNPNPSQPPITVAAGQVTQKTFAIDRLSSLNLNTFAPDCSPLAGVGLTLRGQKLLSTSPVVYKYNHTFSTDAGGFLGLNNLEWDNYDLQLNGSLYDVAATTADLPIALNPGTTLNDSLVLKPHAPQALVVSVADSVSGQPLNQATTTLSLAGSTVAEDLTGLVGAGCGGAGQTFFSGLSNGNYTLTVTRNGYQTASLPVSVGAAWQRVIVSLVAS